MMKLMLLTADEELIKNAQDAGVDRIFLDLEYINKVERQFGRNTVISHNSLDDVLRVRKIVKKGELLVRVNPMHANSEYEISKAIKYGADIIMLPMIVDADDVQRFVNIVNGKAKVCLLLETAQALSRIDDILDVKGIDEVYIGLNDLHISLGLSFMFEPLSCGLVDYMAEKIKAKGLPFGFGGMGKIGEGLILADNILAEHYRIGSTSVILSRTFRNEVGDNKEKIDLNLEIKKIRNEEDKIQKFTQQDFEENRKLIKKSIKSIINR